MRKLVTRRWSAEIWSSYAGRAISCNVIVQQVYNGITQQQQPAHITATRPPRFLVPPSKNSNLICRTERLRLLVPWKLAAVTQLHHQD